MTKNNIIFDIIHSDILIQNLISYHNYLKYVDNFREKALNSISFFKNNVIEYYNYLINKYNYTDLDSVLKDYQRLNASKINYKTIKKTITKIEITKTFYIK